MKKLFDNFLIICAVVLSFSIVCLAQNNRENDSLTTTYDEETNKSEVLLKSIKLPGNKDDFSVGAAFEYDGEKLVKMPCCAVIYFTSISRKKFKFEENHNLIIWADEEKFSFSDVIWRESAAGTAFIIAQVAFPEEIIVGMKTEIFMKIANAKKVKMQLGDFKFSLRSQHLTGLKKLAKKMKLA